jgi:hypothetical protein
MNRVRYRGESLVVERGGKTTERQAELAKRE